MKDFFDPKVMVIGMKMHCIMHGLDAYIDIKFTNPMNINFYVDLGFHKHNLNL